MRLVVQRPLSLFSYEKRTTRREDLIQRYNLSPVVVLETAFALERHPPSVADRRLNDDGWRVQRTKA
jgi:hypothetical protein